MVILKLSREQKKAIVDTLDKTGFWFLIAGAGAGKTAVLAKRIAFILKNKLAYPNEILVLTYTNKAAGEMKERILKETNHPDIDKMQIGTFHSVFTKVLKEHGKSIGIKKVRYQKPYEGASFIRRYLEELGEEVSDNDVKEYCKYVERNKNFLTFPSDIRKDIDDDLKRGKEVSDDRKIAYNVYKNSVKYFMKKQRFDFQDILVYTYEILEKNDEIRRKYTTTFKYILVDEAQDLNVVQANILQQLKDDNNIMCIGDARQSIYGFRGSIPALITKHSKFFKGSKRLNLSNNYRSSNKIVEAANALMRGTGDAEIKNILTDMIPSSAIGDGHDIELHTLSSCANEANFVAKETRRLVEEEGYDYSDIAVLYTRASIPVPTVRVFKANGIPYVQRNERAFWGSSEIKRITSFFSLCDDLGEEKYLYDIAVNVGLKSSQVKAFVKYAQEEGLDNNLIEALRQYPNKKTTEQRKRLYNTLKSLYKVDAKSSIDRIIDEYEILEEIEDTIVDPHECAKKMDNVRALVNIGKDYKGKDFEEFSDEIDRGTTAMDTNKANAVNLITMHSSKGLEYPVVFAIGLEDGFIPHFSAKGKPVEIEESRRLLFVAMTRAMERLYLSHARKRKIGNDEPKKAQASHFLKDIEKYVIKIRDVSRELVDS